MDIKLLLLHCCFLYLCNFVGRFRFGQLNCRFEGQMSIFRELFGIGDLFDAFDDNEAVVGEYESFLFFGQDGVGILDSLYLLAVWFFLDYGQYFAVA